MTLALLLKNKSNIFVLFPASGAPVVAGPSQLGAIRVANRNDFRLVNDGTEAAKRIREMHNIIAK